MQDLVLLALAAFLAGITNAIAGGGTFLTFPALVLSGVPPVAANATSAVAVFPGYLSSALGFRREIASLRPRDTIRLLAITLLGGLAGSLLLLVSSASAFAVVVPFLLLFATTAFLLGPRLRPGGEGQADEVQKQGNFSLLAVSIYGGYFNGGLGIMLLAVFSFWGWTNLNLMNGVKNGLSFALSAISVAVFSLGGLVLWPQALWMMLFAILGGYAGSVLARRIAPWIVRAFVAVVGYSMAAYFFWNLVA
ncbi:MAG: sulfite exporter TauE/SafE family protein [Silicimonas sp.]|nr:sulfite exporter TauE/SafE family protein [Silicimonas sp.]